MKDSSRGCSSLISSTIIFTNAVMFSVTLHISYKTSKLILMCKFGGVAL